MKRLLLVSCVSMPVILLAGCDNTDNMNKSTNTVQKGTKRVERKKTESGLEYEVITEGSGLSPRKGQLVTVHYTGWLNNKGEKGTKFDSSVDRKQPFTFPLGVGHVIRGWDEGVASMKVGETRRLLIPAQLGYGSRGAGAIIPPNVALIFDVELISIS